MKLSYYGYHFSDTQSKQEVLMSVRNFFAAFCAFPNPQYKNQFIHGDEQVYLIHAVGDLYLFLQTKSNELIRKINSNDISVGEIDDLLEQGEMLGFASYIYMKDTYIGFASTMMAPRVNSFVAFVNNVLASINEMQYTFKVVPLLHQASRAEVLKMPFTGRSSVVVNHDSKIFEDIVSILGGTAEEFKDVETLELTLKPVAKKAIGKKAAKKFIGAVQDKGLERMMIRAKDELHGALIDLYVAGQGLVSDTLTGKNEIEILTKIEAKVESNTVLLEKVNAHDQNEVFQALDIKSVAKFCNASAWAAAF